MEAERKAKLIKAIAEEMSEKAESEGILSDRDIMEQVSEAVFRRSRLEHLSAAEKVEIADSVFNSLRRLDILQPFIDDGSVTEIMVNGPGDIFVERDGVIAKADAAFDSREKLENVIQAIVSRVNRAVNESSPIVDARLPDGSRVNVVLPPVAINGPILTIRKFPEKPITMEKLVELGTLTWEAASVLKQLVLARYNIFISGGTSSGKTTFLNALSGCIPQDERIITIEDSAELKILNIKNIVRLETRNANSEGRGEITIRQLIRTSLRMRPERIIVGEVRGAEALDMLQAMNTGHDGSLSTGHANSTQDMFSRLETMVLSGAAMPLEAVRQQIASAIDIIIHLARLRDRSRKVMEISEVLGYENGKIVLNQLFCFRESGNTADGRVAGSLVRTPNRLKNTMKLTMAGINCEI